jgi:hypothetical protein
MSSPISIPSRKVTVNRHQGEYPLLKISYSKILSALESKNLQQITKLVTRRSSYEEISMVLSYYQNDRKLYRLLVEYYWNKVKNSSLTLRTNEDFDCYDELGYNFNNLSFLEYNWLLKNNYSHIISRLRLWIGKDENLSIVRYSPQPGKLSSNFSS